MVAAHTMINIIEPTEILFLLSSFQTLFTAPSYEYFCYFVQSLMGLEREGFVTNVYLSSNSKKHWTNFHRFLSRYRWSANEVSKRLIWLVFKIIQVGTKREHVEIIGALDDTHTEKHGEKFFGVSWYHKPYNISRITTKKESRYGRIVGFALDCCFNLEPVGCFSRSRLYFTSGRSTLKLQANLRQNLT